LKIILASDHAALDLREWLANELSKLGHTTIEVGAPDSNAYDYPDAADDLVQMLHQNPGAFGIAICGTGIGISVRANRYPEIRCALCTTEYMAEMAREHNDANVLALGARVLGTEQALAITKAFMSGNVSSVERHLARIAKLGKDLKS
jgi:ribose 5-phosphate isomerase B